MPNSHSNSLQGNTKLLEYQLIPTKKQIKTLGLCAAISVATTEGGEDGTESYGQGE